MIAPLLKAKRIIEDLKFESKEIVKEGLQEMEGIILDANTEQLSEFGVDANGKQLPLPYAQLTKKIKKAKGQRTDIITLRDTGDFQSGFFATWENSGFFIFSKDEKASQLEKEWGIAIFGLTQQNKYAISGDLRHYLLPKYREALEAFKK